MKYQNIREEELKNKVGFDWFRDFDTTKIIGNIDFSVFPAEDNLFRNVSLLWAEAKTGNFDVVTMFVQLVLTIGKARTFDKMLPPAFLGAFDFKKFAFVPYNDIQDVFYLNDFNWNVTPSNHETKEFLLIKERIEKTLAQNTYVFDFLKDEKELKFFIKNNITNSSQTAKIKIDKNNFLPIYLRWLEVVKPIIEVPDWDNLKKNNILDADFYLADLFVDDKDTSKIEDDTAIRENLFVIFQNQGYKIAKENLKLLFDATINIRNKEAYQAFWKLYKRPPLTEYQEYIIERRDLLVPQDIRERKGAYFTPRQWVELSQKYLTDVFGENWQDEYYIWDCAAGTGNLLAGLTNKYNIFASTLDQADVNVMHERAEHGANLLKKHIFQFDFLNDDFTPISKGGKMPDALFEIISNEEKRKKLVIYINPPYAETATNRTFEEGRLNKRGVSFTKIQEKYGNKIGIATKELFAQFLIRIKCEIPNTNLAQFSKLKIVQGPNFSEFREIFRADFLGGFVCPADTFDNVRGQFPIGFMIWNLNSIKKIENISLDIFDKRSSYSGDKTFYSYKKNSFITDWYKKYHTRDVNKNNIGAIGLYGSDFQHNNFIRITNVDEHPNRYTFITSENLIQSCIYLAVRHCMESTWLNDRDQFLYPKDGWQTDTEFQNDCLAYTLFHGQNRITSQEGVNHWIPFTEAEVNAQEPFKSRFMTDFIAGRGVLHTPSNPPTLFTDVYDIPLRQPNEKLEFSEEATAVFNAGRALWKYYHAQPDANPNASLYDIREYFQGRNDKGRMNSKSEDPHYTELIGALRDCLKILGDKISEKVYEYGFLRR